MAKLELISDGKLSFRCPGCGDSHSIPPRSVEWPDGWDWNGSYHHPTFSPSILRREGVTEGDDRPKKICHSFVTDGNIRFLSDCTHELAGQTVPLPDL